MMKALVAGVVGAGIGIAALTGIAVTVAQPGTGIEQAEFYGGEYSMDEGYDFSQESFPCEEDEALMYSPVFGPDQVGCINLDTI